MPPPAASAQANTPLLVLAALALLLSAASVLGGRRARRSSGARRRGRLGGGDVAAAAGALIALGVLATLALRRGGRPRAAPGAQLAGGDGLDVGERDITVTTVTRIRSSGAVATTTHRLDSIFVSIASYRDGEVRGPRGQGPILLGLYLCVLPGPTRAPPCDAGAVPIARMPVSAQT